MTVRAIDPRLRSNFRALYADIFWFSVLAGSALGFLSIYLTRLGATAFQISLLTAVPAVVNLLFSLPAARWMERKNLFPVTFWSSVLHRSGYLLFIPLAWIFSNEQQIWAIVLLTLLMSIPGTTLAIGFTSMFADVVPPDWRAEVVGKRNALSAVSLTVTTLLSGQILDRVVFPLNFQIVFAIGVLGAGLSTYYLGKLVTPTGQPAWRRVKPPTVSEPLSQAPRLRWWQQLNPLKMTRISLLGPSFAWFMAVYLLFYTFQYMSIPLFPLVQVRILDLSNGMISLGSTLFFMVMTIVSLRMVEISTRLGHKRTLALGASLYGIYPLLMGLARGPALFWTASLLGGGVWAITNAGLVNRLMEKVPQNERTSGMALHNLVLNLGIMVGSLSGPLLGAWLGLQPALLVNSGLRFLAGLLFWIWG
jgi:MFS family permease